MYAQLRYLNFVSNIAYFLFGCGLTYIFTVINVNLPSNSKLGNRLSSRAPKVDLVIVILSAPDNYAERQTLRNTWLKQKGRNSVHIFGIGTEGLSSDDIVKLDNEKQSYGDVLTVPIVDSYRNLTLKVASCLKAISYLYLYKYVLKVDDDSFVNINRLENEVKKIGSPKLYWGYFSPSAHVFSKGRWKETGWYLCDRYLPYAVGGGYLLGQNLAHFIADNYHIFKLYSSEDVSVGVWLAAISSHRIHDIRFDTQAKSRGCWNDQLLKHKVTASDMVEYSKRIDKGLNICKEQVSTDLQPYSYDWSMKPSKCCVVIDPSNISVPRMYSSKNQLDSS